MNQAFSFVKNIGGKAWELVKKGAKRLYDHIARNAVNYAIGIGSALIGGAITSSMSGAILASGAIAAIITLLWYWIKHKLTGKKIDLLQELVKNTVSGLAMPLVLPLLFYMLALSLYKICEYVVVASLYTTALFAL